MSYHQFPIQESQIMKPKMHGEILSFHSFFAKRGTWILHPSFLSHAEKKYKQNHDIICLFTKCINLCLYPNMNRTIINCKCLYQDIIFNCQLLLDRTDRLYQLKLTKHKQLYIHFSSLYTKKFLIGFVDHKKHKFENS